MKIRNKHDLLLALARAHAGKKPERKLKDPYSLDIRDDFLVEDITELEKELAELKKKIRPKGP